LTLEFEIACQHFRRWFPIHNPAINKTHFRHDAFESGTAAGMNTDKRREFGLCAAF
jgi:hypothetical protein